MELQDVNTLFTNEGSLESSDVNIPPDETERDQILQTALTWLGEKGFDYFPFDVEEDINRSYADDSLEDFRCTVRMWLEANVEHRHERNQ